MKLQCLIVPMFVLMLGACTTYPAQTVSNTEMDVDVTEVVSGVNTVTEVDNGVDLDRMICRRTVVTGSRFTKKVCMTWGQWRDQAKDAKDFTSTTQGRARVRTDPTEGG